MKKIDNKDVINVIILILLFLLIIISIIGFNYVNGSTVDWDSQHWIFPEYFRTLFYKTRDMFPSFAFNLGSGQNIYNFSYYGLLSPIVLISYLFPFVRMVDYIQISILIVVILSIVLMYYWLRCKFDRKNTFICTLLFLLSGPLIYHTHRHIMFINYMPFLIMALVGVDNYFNKNKKTLLIMSVFLIIMSSYYYSVGAIASVLLYGIYTYLKTNKKITFGSFIKDGFKFIIPILISIMMSAVLIFPTFYALINGRANITSSVDILSLLVPKFNINELLYNSYTIGVTSIFIIAIIYGFFTKSRNYRFLSSIFTVILLFPIIIYVFSGFMYVRGKVLIPLLPIAIFMVGLFFEKFKVKNSKIFIIMLVLVSFFECIIYINNGNYIFILDVLLVLITLFIYFRYYNKNFIMYTACISTLVCCLISNYNDKLVTKEDIELQNNTYNYDKLTPILESDENIYRVGNDIMGMKNINRVINYNYYLPSVYSSLENQNYYNLANNGISNEIEKRISTAIMPTKNILFNTYTSTKYMITNTGVPIGYKNIENSNVYINDDVLPIGYATSKILSKEKFDSLDYPEKAYSLVTNVVIDKDEYNSHINKTRKENIKYQPSYKNLSIQKEEYKYIIQSEDNGNIILKLSKPYKNKLLFISFDMNYSESCSVGDTSITINNVKNTLSCRSWIYHNKNYKFEYVISSNAEINELDILFDKGKYIISNISVYSLDYSNITNFVHSVDEFMIDKELTVGDEIVGNINVSENGYFVISIPYEEKGFTIYVDDKFTEYEKVDDTFIGFEINEGYHNIKIIYTSPYLFEGMVTSILGYMIFLPIIYSDIFKKRKKDV